MTTKLDADTPPIPITLHPRVVTATERLEQLRERLTAVEREHRGGAIVGHGDDVRRLLANPRASLTAAPDREQLAAEERTLRAAVAEAEREAERVRAEIVAEHARATRQERRERLADLLAAAEHFAAMVDELISTDNTEAGAGYQPVRVVFASDREALARVIARIRHQVETV